MTTKNKNLMRFFAKMFIMQKVVIKIIWLKCDLDMFV